MSFIGVIMLMGLVAKNAILLLDCAREEEKQGIDREEALMHAGRVRLRPILMTTFALVAGMMPVAIGVGEGGEFYRPMAVAIIGGTIVSTLLTLLVVPSFYDSIEISRERAGAKFHARAELGNPFLAFVMTLVEAMLTIVLVFARCIGSRSRSSGRRSSIRWSARSVSGSRSTSLIRWVMRLRRRMRTPSRLRSPLAPLSAIRFRQCRGRAGSPPSRWDMPSALSLRP